MGDNTIKKHYEDEILIVSVKIPYLYSIKDIILKADLGIKPLRLQKFSYIRYVGDDYMKQLQYDENQRNKKLSGRMSFIYALVSPLDMKPFYIGSTRNKLSNRVWSHSRYCTNKFKANIISAIRKQGKVPFIVEMCQVPMEYQFHEEKRWIKGGLKKYKLTNIVNSH